MLNFKSIKIHLIIYLVCFAIFLGIKDRNLTFLGAIVISVLSSLILEGIFFYFRTKLFQITESSIITGLIIGYVVSSDELWWKISLASVLAILSKHLLRYRNRHIFNPAAFGIFLATIILGISTQWKGTYVWYVLLPFGLYFILKIRKLEIIIGYACFSLLLFGLQNLFQNIPLVNIFGYFSYYFIFVMMIEPKTTPVSRAGKFIFGSGVAVMIFILTGLGAQFDVEIFSLLFMNAAVPLLNKITS